MKKVLTVLLTLLMSIALFGCGGSKNRIVGTWNVSNLGDDIDYYFEIEDNTIKAFIDGEEALSSEYVIEDDKIVLTNGKSGELPYSLNDDGTLTIVNNGFELILKKGDVKSKKEENHEDEVIEEPETNPTSEVLTIDLDSSCLKYKEITFDNDYVHSFYYFSQASFEESISGIEIYGVYSDTVEVKDEYRNYSHIILNLPSSIDGKQVISVTDDDYGFNSLTRKLFNNNRIDVKVPDSTLLLSGVGSFHGLTLVPDTMKYVHFNSIDRLPNDIECISGYIYTEQNKVELKDGLSIDGQLFINGPIETVVINSINPRESGSGANIQIGCEKSDLVSNSCVKEVIYSVQNDQRVDVRAYSEKLKVEDNSTIYGYITYEGSLSDNSEVELGNNIFYDKERIIKISNKTKKLIVNDGNISSAINSYDRNLKSEAIVVNRSGEEINWRDFFVLQSDCIFETGKLDFGNYFVEVVKE